MRSTMMIAPAIGTTRAATEPLFRSDFLILFPAANRGERDEDGAKLNVRRMVGEDRRARGKEVGATARATEQWSWGARLRGGMRLRGDPGGPCAR